MRSKAKIFLAEERGCNETHTFRSYYTFNCKGYFNKYKCPFNDLHVFNDNTIAANQSMSTEAEENLYVILLPVVGSLVYKIDQGSENIVHAGQLNIVHFSKNATIEFLNCYENELINFIQLGIKTGTSPVTNESELFTFSLDNYPDELINITAPVGKTGLPAISIGKFAGRRESVYKTMDQSNLFVFVIEGVFEVQGRLLHARDGLVIFNDPVDIELEALSNNAIIFMIES